ncbi:putative gustatory receptor 39b [Anastrepha ludens]|uniref:putative gustatory receptor 39b n=1 Tax=Anastrepha ludens TaxID=28586 RepID=UPI0023AF1644|nr:putative gustatory receptor 39b [Anastrepha ludens]
MERHLRNWLRCCTILGIYLSPVEEDTSILTRSKIVQASNTRRQAWSSQPICHTYLLQRLYLALLALTVCTLYVHGLYMRDIENGLELTWLVATLVYTSQVFTHLFIFMEALWKREQHERFLLLLQEIEVLLKLRLKCDVRKPQLLMSLSRLLLGMVLLSFVGLSVFMTASVLLNDIGYAFHAAWSVVTFRVRILQLLIYTRIMRHYLECLCVKLRQVVACRTSPQSQLLDINYGKLESMELLLAIKENYALIFKAIQLLNDFAGWSLFGIIFGHMLDFTCHVYWTLLGLDGYDSPYNYMVGLPAVLPFSVIVCYLCYVCDKCKKLGNTIAHLVSRLITVTSTQRTQRYCAVVHQLSTQLQLQRIEVTAKHFFVLDLRLIMSICTAIATNLVILIQFLKTENV